MEESGGNRGGFSSYNSAPRGGARGPSVCYAHQRGECQRGESCRFSHSNEEGGGGGGGGGGFSGGYNSAPRNKTGTCYAHQRGECQRGDSCRYNHEEEGTSDASAVYNNRGGDRPRGVCFAFQKGECDRAESCRFSHEAAESSGDYPGGY